jgi:hypothetical protein
MWLLLYEGAQFVQEHFVTKFHCLLQTVLQSV